MVAVAYIMTDWPEFPWREIPSEDIENYWEDMKKIKIKPLRSCMGVTADSLTEEQVAKVEELIFSDPAHIEERMRIRRPTINWALC